MNPKTYGARCSTCAVKSWASAVRPATAKWTPSKPADRLRQQGFPQRLERSVGDFVVSGAAERDPHDEGVAHRHHDRRLQASAR